MGILGAGALPGRVAALRPGGAARRDPPIESSAIVMQDTGCGQPLDAGNRAQILINRAQVVHGHTLKFRPGHDLQEIAVERRRRWKAIRGNRGRARRMQMIQIPPPGYLSRTLAVKRFTRAPDSPLTSSTSATSCADAPPGIGTVRSG